MIDSWLGWANPRAILLMFLIIVFAASTFAVVTRVASSVWISGHHLITVFCSRSVSFMAAALTCRSKNALRSSTLTGLLVESISRRASFTPQATTSSLLGSSVAKTSSRRFLPAPQERVVAAQQQLPVGPCLVSFQAAAPVLFPRDPLARLREHVVGQTTMWKWSTLTAASGRFSRMALRNAAEGSMTTVSMQQSQVVGHALSQTPTPRLSRPSKIPNTCPVSTSTIVDIQGSHRVHFLLSWS